MNKNKGYFGCKECIKENRADPANMTPSGNYKIFIPKECCIECIHHNVPLEWIEPDVPPAN